MMYRRDLYAKRRRRRIIKGIVIAIGAILLFAILVMR